jgi:hypothetical protein
MHNNVRFGPLRISLSVLEHISSVLKIKINCGFIWTNRGTEEKDPRKKSQASVPLN